MPNYYVCFDELEGWQSKRELIDRVKKIIMGIDDKLDVEIIIKKYPPSIFKEK